MKRAVAWFAQNGVAANLLLVVIVVAGAITLPTIRKEVFPEFSSDMITVSVRYRGAAPEEVEEGVCVRVEEAIQGLDGIKRIRSTAAEGSGTVLVELLPGADARKALDDVKARVDAIETFPEQTDKPVVQEVVVRNQVINVAVHGRADETTLKVLGERVRDEIATLPGITQAQVVVARPYEISIEVSEAALRRYHLTFDEVAAAVRRSSLDLPGGSIKTEGGEFLLRVKGQADRGMDYERLPLRTLSDGSRLHLGEVAHVVDGFEDTSQAAWFNDEPAVVVQVFRVGEQNALEVSKTVHRFVADAQARMPAGVTLTPFADYADYLRSRLSLLLRNAAAGFVLVFLILALFLRLRLAFWVSVGIPVSFLGTLWLMPGLDVSISMISLFAFLLVLGIVVDDAIVVGENIYRHHRQGKDGLSAAIDATHEVAVPVVFAVLTSIAAFFPLLTVGGNTGKVMKAIPLIVIPTLLFSLVESMLCVPHHLSHLKPEVPRRGRFHVFERFQLAFSRGLERFIAGPHRRLITLCLEWRYAVFALGIATILVSAGLVGGGILKFQFFPPVEGDVIAAFVTLPEGAPPSAVRAAVRRIETAADRLRVEYGGPRYTTDGGDLFRHRLASVGDQPYRAALSRTPGGNARSFAQPNLGEVQIQLAPSESRRVTAEAVLRRWRELTGAIPGALEAVFTSSLFSSGEAINIQLTGPKVEDLQRAAEELKTLLATYTGVVDITDSYRSGKQEILLDIKPSAEAAGLTLQDLARQVRQAFYGEEAQRFQRERDDIRVMVRYPDEERRSLGNLEAMRVRLPGGVEVPFGAVADAKLGRGYSTIYRVDRRRSVNVTAEVDLTRADPGKVLESLQAGPLPSLAAKYSGLRYALEGEQREQRDTMSGLIRGFILALFLIFALIAVPLKSYLHPFVVMSAIPFGFVGALLGHVIMGMPLTILSMFGLVALAGVAVNDTLVLVDFINRARRREVPLTEAVREVSLSRFRPILLTSLTTFAGLMPLLLEKSVQAKFLIPMGISLGFGVLYCTLTSLVLVPCLYLMLEDVRHLGARLLGGKAPASDSHHP